MVKVYVTSAFSKNSSGGNKAGVVLDAPWLTAAQKMAISKELGYSETAFVTNSSCADFKLEYFTPTEEVPLCGHATIATFVTLHLLGRLPRKCCTIETKSGILEVSVDENGMVLMEQNPPQYYDVLAPEEPAACVGIPADAVPGPIQIISTGLKDIILPVSSPELLHEMKPDFLRMTEYSRQQNVVGIHAFAIPEQNSGVDAVCRNFAPLYGIDEESATGTASCALAGYLAKYGTRKETYIFEQGYSMNLPSRITVKAEYDGDRVCRIAVGGYGYLVEEIMMEY